jgi:hypothetical protein
MRRRWIGLYMLSCCIHCINNVNFTYHEINSVLDALWSRDSSVGIATGYGLDDQGGGEFESR